MVSEAILLVCVRELLEVSGALGDRFSYRIWGLGW